MSCAVCFMRSLLHCMLYATTPLFLLLTVYVVLRHYIAKAASCDKHAYLLFHTPLFSRIRVSGSDCIAHWHHPDSPSRYTFTDVRCRWAFTVNRLLSTDTKYTACLQAPCHACGVMNGGVGVYKNVSPGRIALLNQGN